MFEFSCSRNTDGGFRDLMAERVSRLFEASIAEARISSVSRRQLRPQLRFVGVRSVNVNASGPARVLKPLAGQPRLSASCSDDPKPMLQGMGSRVKRAASAGVFKRIAERLARVRKQSVFADRVVSVSASGPVGQKSVRQSVVALRVH